MNKALRSLTAFMLISGILLIGQPVLASETQTEISFSDQFLEQTYPSYRRVRDGFKKSWGFIKDTITSSDAYQEAKPKVEEGLDKVKESQTYQDTKEVIGNTADDIKQTDTFKKAQKSLQTSDFLQRLKAFFKEGKDNLRPKLEDAEENLHDLPEIKKIKPFDPRTK